MSITPTYDDVIAACDAATAAAAEAGEAADAVLARSDWWLTWHPLPALFRSPHPLVPWIRVNAGF